MNRELALKLLEEKKSLDDKITEGKKISKKATTGSLLLDPRFKDLFEKPDFEIDKSADEFRLLHPAVSRLDKAREKRLKTSSSSTKSSKIFFVCLGMVILDVCV